MSTDPADQIREQLRRLREEDARLAESLKDNRAARHQISAQIRSLEGNLRLFEQLDSPAAAREVAEFQAGTIADAAAALLARAEHPMALTDLVAALQDAGKLLRSPGAYPTLLKAMTRDHRFERVPGHVSTWRLVQVIQ